MKDNMMEDKFVKKDMALESKKKDLEKNESKVGTNVGLFFGASMTGKKLVTKMNSLKNKHVQTNDFDSDADEDWVTFTESIHVRTIQRIWKLAENKGVHADMNPKKVGNCGRKRVQNNKKTVEELVNHNTKNNETIVDKLKNPDINNNKTIVEELVSLNTKNNETIARESSFGESSKKKMKIKENKERSNKPSKKRKKKTNNNGNISHHPEEEQPEPLLAFKEKIEQMEGTEVKVVIQKELTNNDITVEEFDNPNIKNNKKIVEELVNPNIKNNETTADKLKNPDINNNKTIVEELVSLNTKNNETIARESLFGESSNKKMKIKENKERSNKPSKKRKKKTNNNGNISYQPEEEHPKPLLTFKEKIEQMEGAEVNVVIQKELTNSDVTYNNGCLSISKGRVKESFLKPVEESYLDYECNEKEEFENPNTNNNETTVEKFINPDIKNKETTAKKFDNPNTKTNNETVDEEYSFDKSFEMKIKKIKANTKRSNEPSKKLENNINGSISPPSEVEEPGFSLKFKENIEQMGGIKVKLVIQKEVTNNDVMQNNGRLFIQKEEI
ncbi:hypothetical protein KIW84_073087 [Lathyrus oleraceus]|uniref:Uncharacterized protein n=1 Tax=Pisum sativum TaxID=3888 RepID=A0A9D4VMY2_PEA|nr:hypothetical protein KIW84_073087 [Pisum sativum]